jgi:thymidylate kinase
MAKKLIVLTGLDGSGTSSVANELHELDLESYLFNSINFPYANCRDEIDKTVRDVSPAAHYLFYLSAVAYVSKLIDESLTKGNVYCVRYLIDTVVSHRVAGLNVGLVYETDFYEIRKPDLTIFLDVDESLRQQRLAVKGKSYLDRTLDNDVFRLRFLEEFAKLSEHFTKICITDKTTVQIALEIRRLVESL